MGDAVPWIVLAIAVALFFCWFATTKAGDVVVGGCGWVLAAIWVVLCVIAFLGIFGIIGFACTSVVF